jgi:TonB family protein
VRATPQLLPVASLARHLYQGRDNWRIGAAFGTAALIHAALLVAANLYYREAKEGVLGLPGGTVDVVMEASLPPDNAAPPPAPITPPVPPDLTAVSLFPEDPVIPAANRQPITKPIARPRNERPGSSSSSAARALVLSGPPPEYPPEARQRNLTGSGVVVMTIDPSSGSVAHVSMSTSTGSSCLDEAALRGFRRWRFRPGSVSRIKSPVTFTLTASAF